MFYIVFHTAVGGCDFLVAADTTCELELETFYS